LARVSLPAICMRTFRQQKQASLRGKKNSQNLALFLAFMLQRAKINIAESIFRPEN